MKGKASKIFVYTLLGLLILGLAGFGVGSFGGNIRSIGTVGQTPIDINTYARNLQNELRAATQQTGRNFTMADARAVGLDRQVLAQVVTLAALEEETRRRALSVGDLRVAEELRTYPAFQGLSGGFDRQAYEFALDQSGLSPQEFEEDLRADAAGRLIQAAVAGGITAPSIYAETVFNFLGERRSFRVVSLDAAGVGLEAPQPTEADLAAFHAENPDFFTEAETRQITYAWLSPDRMMAEIEVPEQELRDAYEARRAEFVQPERRILYRLVYPDTETALAALGRVQAGEARFDDLVTERGLAIEDVELGEVARDGLAPAIAEAVFALEDTGIVGPLDTSLGPALFNVAGLLNAQEITFDEVRDELEAIAAADRAVRAIQAEIEPIDDLLAGGATLEELAADTAMELGSIGLRPGVDQGIAAYLAFRNAGFAAEQGDFPELLELEDGGIFALRLDEITPARTLPLDAVREEALRLWQDEAELAALRTQADTVLRALATGRSMQALGLSPRIEEAVTRDEFLDGYPPAVIGTVFEMQPGDIEVIDGARAVFIVQLDAILPLDETDPDSAFLRSVLGNQADQSLSQDIFAAFTGAIQAEVGLDLDQAAINAVHANFP